LSTCREEEVEDQQLPKKLAESVGSMTGVGLHKREIQAKGMSLMRLGHPQGDAPSIHHSASHGHRPMGGASPCGCLGSDGNLGACFCHALTIMLTPPHRPNYDLQNLTINGAN